MLCSGHGHTTRVFKTASTGQQTHCSTLCDSMLLPLLSLLPSMWESMQVDGSMRILRRYTLHDWKLQRQQPICESNLVFLRTFGGPQSCM